MRHLFGMGDSISHGYHPYLEKLLPPDIAYTRQSGEPGDPDNPTGHSANSGNSSMVLDYLTRRLQEQDFQPDYLLLNCGLHDLRQDIHTKAFAIPPEQYRTNLMAICDALERRQIGLIWINTTPVDDETHRKHMQEFQRRDENVLRYNQIAEDVVSDFAALTIDLYAFTHIVGAIGVTLYADHVHFEKEVSRLQAAYIAGMLTAFFDV